MSRLTVEVQNAQDVHISVPNWLFKLIGFLMALWVIFWSVAILMEGYPAHAFFLLIAGSVLIPISLVFTYMYWRFFWWLNAAALLCSTGFLLPAGIIGLLTGWKPSALLGKRPLSGSLSANIPVENIAVLAVTVLLLALLMFVLRRRRAAAARDTTASFEFPTDSTPAIATFQQRVANMVSTKGKYQTAIEMDTIRVYNGKRLVGVVKCIDKPGKPVSPVMVKEAQKLAERNGVQTAYLATSGYFPADAKSEADRLQVKTIEI